MFQWKNSEWGMTPIDILGLSVPMWRDYERSCRPPKSRWRTDALCRGDVSSDETPLGIGLRFTRLADYAREIDDAR